LNEEIKQRLGDHLKDVHGILHIEGISAVELADAHGTPVYVTSESRIRANYRRFFSAFSRHGAFRLYYAAKANTNLSILNIIRQEGGYIDCSCPAEILAASLSGFQREKMLYTGNYNSTEEFLYALDAGITINLDDASMVDRLPQDVPKSLCFRINPGVGKGGREGLVFAGDDAKFGSSEETVAMGYSKAKALGVEHFGIHMMTGSNVLDPEYFPQITERLMDIAGRIARKTGIDFDFVNVGGGFGVPYGPGETELPLEEVAKKVVSVFKAKTSEYGLKPPVLAAEPGRYIVADSTVLLAKVCHIKRAKKTFVGVDAGMNTLLRPALYGAYHPVVIANKMDDPDSTTVNICGQVCENTDILAKDRRIPAVQEGDILAFLNAGAYGYAMSSQYNNRPRAAEVLVSDGKAELIRRRETILDLFQGQTIPARLLP
jgi:diaminopimelate decarboxylase